MPPAQTKRRKTLGKDHIDSSGENADEDHQPIYITTYKARVAPKHNAVSQQQQQSSSSSSSSGEPNSRGVAQDLILAPSASELPDDTKSLIQNWNFPLIRIGELFKITFKPVSQPSHYQVASRLENLGSDGQAAVQVSSSFMRRDNEMKSKISIESFYWDPVARNIKCLRCVQNPDECECIYNNDLLNLSKFDRFTSEPYGHIGITLRIPRDRDPPTPTELAQGVTKSNAWLSKLPTTANGTGVRRPKLMMLRVTEELYGAEGGYSKPLFSVQSLGYVRLVAKNGCMKEKQQLNQGIARNFMKNLIQIEKAKASRTMSSDSRDYPASKKQMDMFQSSPVRVAGKAPQASHLRMNTAEEDKKVFSSSIHRTPQKSVVGKRTAAITPKRKHLCLGSSEKPNNRAYVPRVLFRYDQESGGSNSGASSSHEVDADGSQGREEAAVAILNLKKQSNAPSQADVNGAAALLTAAELAETRISSSSTNRAMMSQNVSASSTSARSGKGHDHVISSPVEHNKPQSAHITYHHMHPPQQHGQPTQHGQPPPSATADKGEDSGELLDSSMDDSVDQEVKEELGFYLKVKKSLGRGGFQSFLKLLTMYCHDVISRQELTNLVHTLLWEHPHLMAWFEKCVGITAFGEAEPIHSMFLKSKEKSNPRQASSLPLGASPLSKQPPQLLSQIPTQASSSLPTAPAHAQYQASQNQDGIKVGSVTNRKRPPPSVLTSTSVSAPVVPVPKFMYTSASGDIFEENKSESRAHKRPAVDTTIDVAGKGTYVIEMKERLSSQNVQQKRFITDGMKSPKIVAKYRDDQFAKKTKDLTAQMRPRKFSNTSA